MPRQIAVKMVDEMEAALALIPVAREMHVVEGGGHGLVAKREGLERLHKVVRELPPKFLKFASRIKD